MPKLAGSTFSDDDDFDAVAAGASPAERRALVDELAREMLAAAEALEFERAADLRDRIKALKKHL